MTSSELRERLDTLIDTTTGINHRPSIRLAIDTVTEAITALEAAEQRIAELDARMYRYEHTDQGDDARYIAEGYHERVVGRLREQAKKLAVALDVTLDQIRTFRIWFEDDYTRFVDLPDDDPLLEETARLGLIGQAGATLDAYRKIRRGDDGLIRLPDGVFAAFQQWMYDKSWDATVFDAVTIRYGGHDFAPESKEE